MANEPLRAEKPREAEKPADGEAKDGKLAESAPPSRWFGIILVVGLTLGSAAAAVVASTLVAPTAAPADAVAANPDQTAALAASTDTSKGDQKDEAAKQEAEIITYNLLDHMDSKAPLAANVYRTQQRRYLSVNPVFVLKDKAAKEAITKKHAELVHVLLALLKTKTLEDLDAPEAVNTMAREIQEAVNTQLDLREGIKSVYFTQFVVQ